jgi:EAL domain-containing protein (putative c-di-GMP-specific phosphodiesterase class I)
MQLQPDVIKLAPDLTAALASGRVSSIAADNVFRYCRHEGVFMVAVGVEHHDQIGPLRDRGVDATQGQVHTTSTVDVPRFDLTAR